MMYIIQRNKEKREVDYKELNQLKKDILWIYDENIGELNCAFAPSYSFKMRYWEYLTLDGDKWFDEEERRFYKKGVLVILLCFCVEYNDIGGGDQEVFSVDDFSEIIDYVEQFKPSDDLEERLKNRLLLGLGMANSLTKKQLLDTDFVHEGSEEFLKDLKKMGDEVIVAYYEAKLKEYRRAL